MKRFHGCWCISPHPADPQKSSLATLEQVAGTGCGRWAGGGLPRG
jgi:hypothetical protein